MLTDSTEIRIETCTLCSYDCVMCPRDVFTRRRTVMPSALFDEIAARAHEEMPQLRTITVSGFGEFSLDPDWRRKIETASRLYDRVHVVTNLQPLAIDDLDHLLEHVDDVRVSLYATSDPVYRAVHRPPATARVREIEDRVRYIAAHRREGQRLILTFLELDGNRAERAAWMDRWSTIADLVEVWLPHNWIDGRAYRHRCEHRLQTCGRPAHGPVQVQVDGTVNVCCFDFNGVLTVGDLRVNSLREIYDGPGMTRVQKLHESGHADEIAACRVCDQRDCGECKSAYLVHSSRFDRRERIELTATSYEALREAHVRDLE